MAIAACFLVYDFVFLPPYYTLYVDRAEDWVALGVYAVVMVLVARVVAAANADQARVGAAGGARSAAFSTFPSCWCASCRRRSSSTRSSIP